MFSGIVLSNGDVYTTGNNNRGQLGIGNNIVQYEYIKVPNIENALEISCGNEHMIVLLKDGTVTSGYLLFYHYYRYYIK